ncbi:proline--tRNA ligase [Candidatus Woesearchaeota archaeon]|nr:proline--tRNA ligase [Candidatus Woesearchaeota archaeon]
MAKTDKPAQKPQKPLPVKAPAKVEKGKDNHGLGVTAKKAEDMPEWYAQTVLKAEMAEYSNVKGCMIIRPYGYSVWENIQAYFNSRIKALGVKNAYFPLFIPEVFFKKEASHAAGFKPEVAWIANTMESGERLAVRPTSEAMICDSFSRWIRSHRDLPMRLNQWCNVVRWETEATKLFLRSREFLWQEGHCAYATREEAEKETLLMLAEYATLCEGLLALPVIMGKKTPKETFAGAVYSTTIESFMPDGKALQCGTSHYLGENFAKSFEIKYMGKDEQEHYAHTTSWGISTRLIGAMVMMHGDDKGLVLPPRIAPTQAVIVPIILGDPEKILARAKQVASQLKDMDIVLDDRDEYTPGWKYSDWEMRGVPVRIEIGPKDVEKDQVVLVRRDTGEKQFVKTAEIKKALEKLLEDIQQNLYKRAKAFMDAHVTITPDWNNLLTAISNKRMAKAQWCGEHACEEEIKAKTEGVSSRCIPFDQPKITGNCVHCNKKAKVWVLFGRAY